MENRDHCMSIKQAKLVRVNAHKHNLINWFCNNGLPHLWAVENAVKRHTHLHKDTSESPVFGFRCQMAENYRCCLLHLLTHWHLSSRERVLAGGGQLQWPARRLPAVSVTWKYGFRIRFAIAGMSHSFSPVENTEKLLGFLLQGIHHMQTEITVSFVHSCIVAF